MSEAILHLKTDQDEPVRVSLIGEDPANCASVLLTRAGAVDEVRLPPGKYAAMLQSVADNSRYFTTIEVKAGDPQPQPFTLDMLSRIPAAKTAPPPAEGSIFMSLRPDAGPQPFSLGLSMKAGTSGSAAAPDPTSWSGADNVDVSALSSPEGVPTFEIQRRYDWRTNPRVRLTLKRGTATPVRMPIPLFRDGVRCRLVLSGADLKVHVEALDPKTALLVSALTRLFPDEQQQVVTEGSGGADPIEMLAGKLEDPWAAAVAAQVLIRGPDIKKVAQWVHNLRNWHPWLVDGIVADAWTIAATGDGARASVEKKVLATLIDARRLGTPYFMAANRLALEMLSLLANGGARKPVRESAGREREIWAARTRLAIRAGPYLAWEVNEDVGDLAPPAYRPVGAGTYDTAEGVVGWAEALAAAPA